MARSHGPVPREVRTDGPIMEDNLSMGTDEYSLG